MRKCRQSTRTTRTSGPALVTRRWAWKAPSITTSTTRHFQPQAGEVTEARVPVVTGCAARPEIAPDPSRSKRSSSSFKSARGAYARRFRWPPLHQTTRRGTNTWAGRARESAHYWEHFQGGPHQGMVHRGGGGTRLAAALDAAAQQVRVDVIQALLANPARRRESRLLEELAGRGAPAAGLAERTLPERLSGSRDRAGRRADAARTPAAQVVQTDSAR